MEKRKQFSKVLGNELKLIRLSLDLTMGEMSAKTTLSQTVINYYEKGQRIPSIDALIAYSTSCKVDFEYLFKLRVQCIKESEDVLDDSSHVNLKNEYALIMYYENLLKQQELLNKN